MNTNTIPAFFELKSVLTTIKVKELSNGFYNVYENNNSPVQKEAKEIVEMVERLEKLDFELEIPSLNF